MNAPAEILPDQPQQLLHRFSTFIASLHKTLLTIGGLICISIFWLCGKTFRIPEYPHLSASLFQQSSLISTLLIVAIAYAICVFVGLIVCGSVGFDSGIFCACIGLLGLSARGGAMRFTLFSAAGPDIWITLIFELILLAFLITAGSLLQRFFSLHDHKRRDAMLQVHNSIDQKFLALATNIVLIVAMMMLFSASDRKMQAIFSLALSSFIATTISYYLVPTERSAWFWAAPLMVGLLGYSMQYFGNTSAWRIGQAQGTFAALARPLPLDYAGSSVAFSIFGYWSARQWHRENPNTSPPESVN